MSRPKTVQQLIDAAVREQARARFAAQEVLALDALRLTDAGFVRSIEFVEVMEDDGITCSAVGIACRWPWVKDQRREQR